MREKILNIKNEALAQIMAVESERELAQIKQEYLGRKGKINELFKEMVKLAGEEKKEAGRLVNEAKQAIEQALMSVGKNFNQNEDEWFDVTLPGKLPRIGNLHPQTKVLEEIIDIFRYLGYKIADGPEVETDYYNFEALNFPKDHPARDTQQTLVLDNSGTKSVLGELLLRTQTSAMQGRVMEKMKPPFRVLVPGKCFRRDEVDASHGFEFWQVEGFVVDNNIRMTDLFGTIEFVLKSLFGEKAKIRFATTNFPFVEPGVDTYLQCTVCGGKGCAFCKKTGWSEIMPAGMIHPNLLKFAGIDSRVWGGFAFAIGLSRVVTLRYKIDDLRVLTTPNVKILRQF